MVRLTVQKCLFRAQRYPKLLGRSAWCQWGQIDIFPAQYCTSQCTKYKQYKQMKKSNTTPQQNLFTLAIFSWDTWWSITFWRSGGCFIVSHNAVFVWSKHVLLQGKFRQTSFTKTKMLHVCLLFHKLNLVVGHSPTRVLSGEVIIQQRTLTLSVNSSSLFLALALLLAIWFWLSLDWLFVSESPSQRQWIGPILRLLHHMKNERIKMEK